jgi:hypothetical protein
LLEIIALLWLGGIVAIICTLLISDQRGPHEVFYGLASLVWPLMFTLLGLKALVRALR